MMLRKQAIPARAGPRRSRALGVGEDAGGAVVAVGLAHEVGVLAHPDGDGLAASASQ